MLCSACHALTLLTGSSNEHHGLETGLEEINGDFLEADFWTILAAGFERHSFKGQPLAGTHWLGMTAVTGPPFISEG
jgi:hypothetical protein